MIEEDRPKILIIEDEALVARELKSRLTQMGCEVVGIAYGREGIDLAKQTRPDLLLADIHLKDGADGIEVAGTIQRERDLPVVFLTAYSDKETVSRAKLVTPYSFIIKPVENRELQIAIEMALYKFNIERELRETRQLLETALACIGNALVFLDAQGRVTNLNDEARQLLGIEDHPSSRNWRKLLSVGGDASVVERVESALKSDSVTKLAPFLLPGDVPHLVDGIVGPLDSGGVLILRELSEINDPIEMLPATEELLSRLGPDQLGPSESALCQLLIYPDIPGIDESHQRLEEASSLLNKVVRSTDLVSVYAGSLLSVSMPYTSVEEGKKIADTILQELRQHVFEGDDLASFSIGFAHSNPGDQQPFELFRRAGWALNIAIESGGNRVVVWSRESEKKIESHGSHATASRDYHNMVLLWNVMSVVAKAKSLQELSTQFCSHLALSFGLEKAAVIAWDDGRAACLGGTLGDRRTATIDDLGLTRKELDQIKRLCAGPGRESRYDDMLLLTLDEGKVLLMQGTLNDADVEFVRTLTRYFSTSVAGMDLSDRESLPGEVGDNELIVESDRMEGVVENARLVAGTDATVLISGESGTGKELLARAIHAMSPRNDMPFIVVDCGAVVGSLIESELFGYVKGAFTGADKNFSGRLKEADGGTILLDEIGELPLDVQVKLLRFVQEHEVIPVGTNTVYTVDTRVIAATNKNLKDLVDKGRFREDLYYRLNVFSIESPPLRKRREAILPLARHYLARFCGQYEKQISGFSEEAERALLDHEWPGNVRELVNVINRAVILCKDSMVNTIHLGLFPHRPVGFDGVDGEGRDSARESRPPLEVRLRALVDRCLDSGSTRLPPLGQWLEEDLIIATLRKYDDSVARAAMKLALPESTLRRKIARLQEQYAGAPPPRPDNWVSIDTIVDDLVDAAAYQGLSVPDLVSRALLYEIDRRNLSKVEAAGLMGVSLPTYRRMTS